MNASSRARRPKVESRRRAAGDTEMRTLSQNRNSRIRELSVVELAPHWAEEDIFIRPVAL
jgi:hypothetical protein